MFLIISVNSEVMSSFIASNIVQVFRHIYGCTQTHGRNTASFLSPREPHIPIQIPPVFSFLCCLYFQEINFVSPVHGALEHAQDFSSAAA